MGIRRFPLFGADKDELGGKTGVMVSWEAGPRPPKKDDASPRRRGQWSVLLNEEKFSRCQQKNVRHAQPLQHFPRVTGVLQLQIQCHFQLKSWDNAQEMLHLAGAFSALNMTPAICRYYHTWKQFRRRGWDLFSLKLTFAFQLCI